MKYVNKNSAIHVEEVTEKGVILETLSGTYYPKFGDYIATGEGGYKFIIDKEYFEENYIPLENRRIDTDFSTEEIARAYAEGLPSNEENWGRKEYVIKRILRKISYAWFKLLKTIRGINT